MAIMCLAGFDHFEQVVDYILPEQLGFAATCQTIHRIYEDTLDNRCLILELRKPVAGKSYD